MAKPAHHQKTKAIEILAAARSVLEEGGYGSLTAKAVAERAGVNKALVFYYFNSTNELFERVLEDYYERHRADLERGFRRGEGAGIRIRVHHLIDAYLNSILANQVYAQIVHEQIATGGPHIEIVKRHFSKLLDWTRQLFASVLPGDGPLAAHQFHISLSGMVMHYFTHAPVFGAEVWGREPMSGEALEERRAHLHWVADAWLDALEAGGVMPPS
jgi:AcrR family transcriptional regulator